MNIRLKQFLAAENISQAQFADNINVVRASVSHVLSGRNNPSFDFIKAMMQKYPRLNMEWLMFGKGKMYKDALLFDDDDSILEDPVRIVEPSPMMEDTSNMQPINEINNSINSVQQSVNQRKVSKIIVLFDDGSFQEM